MQSDEDRLLVAIENMRHAAIWARAKDIHSNHYHVQRTGPNIMAEVGHRTLVEEPEGASEE